MRFIRKLPRRHQPLQELVTPVPQTRNTAGANQSTAGSGQDAAPGTATVLQPDPVCGTYVSIDSSLKKIVGGKVYHFCSPECRDKFLG